MLARPATVPASAHSPLQNHLLGALGGADFKRLQPHLELLHMRLGEVLYEPDTRMSYAYFPTTAIASLHYVIESGASAESAGVGNEGVVGVSLFMGGNSTPSSAVVQTAGHGYRVRSAALKQEFDRAGALQILLLRYMQALMSQMCHTAACNRHHSIEQQLCRWLLQTMDRMQSSELVMTQELIARMLGVRREGITAAAGRLQQAGCVRHRRGHITVVDRAGLEARVCECYAVLRKELRRLLPETPARREAVCAVG